MNKHTNLGFIYPFPCDSGRLKWQGFGYDLQLKWFSISHHCHPQIRQWMRSSGTLHPPPLPISSPFLTSPQLSTRDFSYFTFQHCFFIFFLPLTYLYSVINFLMSFSSSLQPIVSSLYEACVAHAIGHMVYLMVYLKHKG